MDKKLGKNKSIDLLLDVLTVTDKKSKNGFIFRDIAQLQDGNYYLPAMSIPYVGKEIANINGVAFNKFWAKNYAAALGRAKAILLLRYGLQLQNPNTQNILIQLDRNLKPTGKIIFRDLSDSYFVKQIALAQGYVEAIKTDKNLRWGFYNYLVPNWENSTSGYTKAGGKSIPLKTLEQWREVHDQAYFDTLEDELHVKIEVLLPATNYLPSDLNYQTNNSYLVESAEKFLFSADGEYALKRYLKR